MKLSADGGCGPWRFQNWNSLMGRTKLELRPSETLNGKATISNFHLYIKKVISGSPKDLSSILMLSWRETGGKWPVDDIRGFSTTVKQSNEPTGRVQ